MIRPNAYKDAEKLNHSHFCKQKHKMVQPLWGMAVSYKTKMCFLGHNQKFIFR